MSRIKWSQARVRQGQAGQAGPRRPVLMLYAVCGQAHSLSIFSFRCPVTACWMVLTHSGSMLARTTVIGVPVGSGEATGNGHGEARVRYVG
jgi:hypothetical protein